MSEVGKAIRKIIDMSWISKRRSAGAAGGDARKGSADDSWGTVDRSENRRVGPILLHEDGL